MRASTLQEHTYQRRMKVQNQKLGDSRNSRLGRKCASGTSRVSMAETHKICAVVLFGPGNVSRIRDRRKSSAGAAAEDRAEVAVTRSS